MPKIPIIMDCDPGHDDAIALLWALSEPEKLDLKAVTIVAGNQTLANTTRNALRVLTFSGGHGRRPAADAPLDLRAGSYRDGARPVRTGRSGDARARL